MIDGAALLRTGFAALWISGQAALILTAGQRPDAAFGFRMFSESSILEVHLTRTVQQTVAASTTGADARARTEEPVEDGTWTEHDARGRGRLVSWTDRVKEPRLARFDRRFAASYSAEAQLQRWKAALDDVAAHLPADGDTRALHLTITVWRNGREPQVTHATAEVPAR